MRFIRYIQNKQKINKILQIISTQNNTKAQVNTVEQKIRKSSAHIEVQEVVKTMHSGDTSCRLCLGRKVELEHTAKSTAN